MSKRGPRKPDADGQCRRGACAGSGKPSSWQFPVKAARDRPADARTPNCGMVSQNQEAPMIPRHFALQLTLLAAAMVPVLALGVQPPSEEGFAPLFNGKD